MDKFFEDFVNYCEKCQINCALHTCTSMGRHKKYLVRIHVDYVGPFLGKIFILINDSFPKWIQVFPVEIPYSKVAVRYLRRCFATLYFPKFVLRITLVVLQVRNLQFYEA